MIALRVMRFVVGANASDQATASVNGAERHSLSKATRRAPPAGGGNTLLTRQIAFEPLPASVLFASFIRVWFWFHESR